VKTIGYKIFNNCKAINKINYNGTMEELKKVKVKRSFLVTTLPVKCIDGESRILV
jgi:hypothetical protein